MIRLNVNNPNEYVGIDAPLNKRGVECTVVQMVWHADGAENIECLIRIHNNLVWVPFAALKYQCCSECGI